MRALKWGIKASLVDYVSDLPDGRIQMDGGADRLSDGTFAFREAVDLEDDPGSALRFSGCVTLEGHMGMLSLPLKNPWIEAVGDGWLLTIVDPDEPPKRMGFAVIAGLAPAGGGATRGHRVSLTADGADLIVGPYDQGTQFDDFLVLPDS